MRPIKLSIKGLNSFVETQTIDFDQLTQHGLFGVFGPTGSGKSTILDGITLALYGKTSRNSNNFINTQCDQMQVVFQFAVNHIEYEVVRSYRRQKESIHASKPTRLLKGIEVLAESTKEVDKYCLDIIGLKFEDFIRTVVLPQGKFSEFIKLKGKDRRNMLERLFNLEKYGDDFSSKLNRRIRKLKDRDIELAGQLKNFEDVSMEIITSIDQQIGTSKLNLLEIEKDFNKSQNSYQKQMMIFEHQKQLDQALVSLKKLGQEDVKGLKEKIKVLEEVRPMVPLYSQFQSNKKVLTDLSEKLIKLQDQLSKDYARKDSLVNAYMLLKETYQDQLQDLQEKGHNLKTAIEVLKHVTEKEITLMDLNKENSVLEKELETNQSLVSKSKSELDLMEATIQALEAELMVHGDYLTYEAIIDQGYDYVIEKAQIEKELSTRTQFIEEKILQVKEQVNELNHLNSHLSTIEVTEENMSFEAYQLAKEKLIDLKQEQESKKETYLIRQGLLDRLTKNKDNFKSIKFEYDQYISSKQNQLVFALQKDLNTGEACPVCGSEITILPEVEIKLLDASAEENYHKHLLEKETLEKSIAETETLVFDQSALEGISDQLIDLDLQYQKSLDNEKKLLEKEHLLVRLKDIEAHIKSLNDEIQQAQTKDQESRLVLSGLTDKITSLCSDEIQDFKLAKKKLKAHKEKVLELDKHLKEKQRRYKEVEEVIKSYSENIAKVTVKQSVLQNDIKHLKTFLHEKRTDLKARFGEVNLKELLKKTVDEESQLIERHSQLEADAKAAELAYQQTHQAVQQTDLLIKTKETDQRKLEADLEPFDQESLADFNEKDLLTYKTTLETYEKEYAILTKQVEDLEKAINGQTITHEVLIHLEGVIKDLEIKRDNLIRQIAVAVENKERLEKRYTLLKDLLDQKTELEHQLDLHSDLDKLFRGKKFVEFIASYQLRHVTLAASERLYEITSGKYGLELDDSMFIVRDFKNGGAMRSMSTLSGGESFLVSLSLALALSSQIQLKGSAPLEFFFLDEGFGTLDDYVLDMVMTALEKIHHQFLSIGLISHVEKIKNRVPIKINVIPSSIETGSLVKIEKT